MRTVKDLLCDIQGKTGMYIQPSLASLSGFIRGYGLALKDCGQEDYFENQFRDWLASRGGLDEKHSWEQILLFQCDGDHDAFNQFWKLFRIFCAK